MLTIENLARPGLEPASLQLAGGECAAVFGPSGSGKSLLLRAIADLDPSTGRVSLDGKLRETMAAPAWRRRVCYVPAESGWWADDVGGHFADEQAATGFLHLLGLPAAALDWPVERLSTGERQRLALIRAVVQAPDVLLLDEPTSGLDAEATARVEGVLHERLADGAAILLVTHDPKQAERLAQHRYEIGNGRLRPADAAGEGEG
jgi:ABC-type iron transport system FetAB ATPase subunit